MFHCHYHTAAETVDAVLGYRKATKTVQAHSPHTHTDDTEAGYTNREEGTYVLPAR